MSYARKLTSQCSPLYYQVRPKSAVSCLYVSGMRHFVLILLALCLAIPAQAEETFIRIFKAESELELWSRGDGETEYARSRAWSYGKLFDGAR